MENCKGIVMFCPMLSILFVGTRMLALQLTDSKGAPQGWCQDGMYMATWSLLIQFVMAPDEPEEVGSLFTAGCKEFKEDLPSFAAIRFPKDLKLFFLVAAVTLTRPGWVPGLLGWFPEQVEK